jgi:sarcosine oxidase
MGSSISYNLAGRGLKVLTLERFGLNHEYGSSHGKTRIIRLAYYEDPRYVPLLRRAFASWDELARRSGAKIIRRTGGLMIGRKDGPLVTGVLRIAKEYSLPHRLLDSRETSEIFGALRLEEGYSVVSEQNAGILFPERCISSYVTLARESGAIFGFSERVVSWRRTTSTIEV